MAWIEGPNVPESMEGKQAWKYVDGAHPRVTIDVVPCGFSRDPHHCGGVFFWPIEPPAPPGTESNEGVIT